MQRVAAVVVVLALTSVALVAADSTPQYPDTARTTLFDPTTASGTSGFGDGALAVSYAGVIVVGAHEADDYGQLFNGVVYVYTYDNETETPGDATLTQTIRSPVNGTGLRFGKSVAVSHDASFLVVGAPGDTLSRGAVMIYERSGTSYVYAETINGTVSGNFNEFGLKVAMGQSFGSTPFFVVQNFPNDNYIFTGPVPFTLAASKVDVGSGALCVSSTDVTGTVCIGSVTETNCFTGADNWASAVATVATAAQSCFISENHVVTGDSVASSGSGRISVYDRSLASPYDLVRTLPATVASSTGYGSSVYMDRNETYIVAGARNLGYFGAGDGGVFVFHRGMYHGSNLYGHYALVGQSEGFGSAVAVIGDSVVATSYVESGGSDTGILYVRTGSPAGCAFTSSGSTPVCGDGAIHCGEVCDDGNVGSSVDGCDGACRVRDGWSCSPSCTSVCGDGVVVGTETCDDGNVAPSDGCSADCAVENGFECTVPGAACRTICGDGIIAGDETCEESVTELEEGEECDELCRLQAPETFDTVLVVSIAAGALAVTAVVALVAIRMGGAGATDPASGKRGKPTNSPEPVASP